MECKEEKKRGDQVLAGTVGAFLGSLVGVLCIVIMGRLGYMASLSGLVMAVCALKGYELLGGGLSKRGAVISSVLILVMTYFADRLDWAFIVADAYDIGITEAFRSIGYLLEAGAIESGSYWANLVMLYLFTLLGAVPTMIAGLRNIGGTPLPPPTVVTGEAVSQQDHPAAQFYPTAKGWMRPLRTSALVAMFLPLVLTLILLSLPAGDDTRMALVLGAMGSLAGMLIVLVWFFPHANLFQADNVLFVRTSDGLFWRVMLQQLNAMAPYRYTSSSQAAFAGVRWFRLRPEEQERAKDAILRAIDDLRSGRPTPKNLGRYVIPLTDLSLIKEDRWQWTVSYQRSNGSKKLSVPKSYPDLRLLPEVEVAQGPVPMRWGILVMSVLCTAALAAAGFFLGLSGSTPSGTSPDAPYTVASAPDSVTSHEINGVQYEVDAAYLDGGDHTYYDEEHLAFYMVSAYHGISEEEVLDTLLQPIGDSRTDDTFESFRLDRTDADLAPLTGRSGSACRYNILSLHYTDGTVYHTGVAYFDNGTLVVVQALQSGQENEGTVKSDILYILESLIPTEPGSDAV